MGRLQMTTQSGNMHSAVLPDGVQFLGFDAIRYLARFEGRCPDCDAPRWLYVDPSTLIRDPKYLCVMFSGIRLYCDPCLEIQRSTGEP